jgi:hypothetical protein
MFLIIKRASHFQVVCVSYDSAGTANVLNNETSESLPSCVCVSYDSVSTANVLNNETSESLPSCVCVCHI